MPATSFKRRALRFVRRGAVALAAIYLLLLVPDPEPPAPRGAGQAAFTWKQDPAWTALEQQFVTLRAGGCNAIAERTASALGAIGGQLAAMATNTLPPEDAAFAS